MNDNKLHYTPRRPVFKTPKSHTLTRQETEYSAPVGKESESDESTKSSTTSENGSGDDLSIVAEFDELMRLVKQQRADEVEDKFIDCIEQMKELQMQWKVATEECQRLKMELDKRTGDCREMECQLFTARKYLDEEKKRSRNFERDRDQLEAKIGRAAELLFNNRTHLPDETRQQLAFLHNPVEAAAQFQELSAIQEVNTTGSLLSDWSYSCSGDDLDVSRQQRKAWKNHRPSTEYPEEPASKKRRSCGKKTVEINAADTVRATTTLMVGKDGPITATSIIESVPPEHSHRPQEPKRQAFNELHPSAPPEHLVFDLWQRNSPRTATLAHQRKHCFQTKTVVMPDICGPCNKRIRFGKTVLKCKDCRAVCHPECKDLLPLPCVPLMNTPTQRGMPGVIADYTPTTPPMVPALIIHCVNEIEIRGLHELGIYRVPGSERDVKNLKEKFLRGKHPPCLNQIDVHVICGTVKDFLRSLNEPIITHGRWKDFLKAVEARDEADIAPVLYQIVSELPQPNRDTLAYMILHLKRVAESPDCKMPIKNLAKVFGPTIVGYSSADPDPTHLLIETRQQCMIMEKLMELPNDYWNCFLNNNSKTPSLKLHPTPSTDSLLCTSANKGIFTPHGIRSLRKKQKLFPTPPYK